MNTFIRYLFSSFLLSISFAAFSQPAPPVATTQAPKAANGSPQQDYRLGAGDSIGIQVFQSPDLSVDARVSESGVISYPLVGSLELGGLTISEAE
ncbi:MAG: polysaccharide biosynthesis/export family protein, partial [Polaromonas sp.]|nr:polysaccharide biosynthesis/export family protein [Polaromonas sp.]